MGYFNTEIRKLIIQYSYYDNEPAGDQFITFMISESSPVNSPECNIAGSQIILWCSKKAFIYNYMDDVEMSKE